MEPQQWTFTNRAKWGPGEWDSEPSDKVFWLDEATGLPCICHRSQMGTWNGYVAVLQSHPLFEIDYNSDTPVLSQARAELLKSTDAEMTTARIIECLAGDLRCSPGSIFECHGGLTFSGKNRKPDASGLGVGIEPETKPLWWFGFDCNHYGDFAPGMAQYSGMRDGVYRSLNYVRSEVTDLARQLAAIVAV